jgi:type IV fimbrial biogenesis protein FimT
MPSVRASRGFTIIELMITITIFAVLLAVGLPNMADFLRNSRLREAGNMALGEAMFARNEAIKRNGIVRLTVSGTQLTVTDESRSPVETIRTRTLPAPVAASGPTQTIEFASAGRTRPFGTAYSVDFVHENLTCTADLRCPRLNVNAGGSACVKHLNITVSPDPCP